MFLCLGIFSSPRWARKQQTAVSCGSTLLTSRCKNSSVAWVAKPASGSLSHNLALVMWTECLRHCCIPFLRVQCLYSQLFKCSAQEGFFLLYSALQDSTPPSSLSSRARKTQFEGGIKALHFLSLKINVTQRGFYFLSKVKLKFSCCSCIHHFAISASLPCVNSVILINK